MKDFLNALELWGLSINKNILLVLAVVLGVRLILWFFGAVGVYKISKKEKLNNPWLSFVLPIYPLSLGRITEKFVKKDGTKPVKYGVWLLVMSVLSVAFYVTFFIVFAISFTTITQFALKVIETDASMTLEMFSSAIYTIILYFVALTVYLVYFVMYIVALWRIFKLYDSKNAVFFTTLSVLLKFVSPILIYIVSFKLTEGAEDNQPVGFYFDE